jgi:hypothetical protein
MKKLLRLLFMCQLLFQCLISDAYGQCNLPTPVINSNVDLACQSLPPDRPFTETCIQVCEGSETVLWVNNTGGTFTWSIGGGNQTSYFNNQISVIWPTAGNGIVHVTQNFNGCTVTSEICVIIVERPTANFITAPYAEAIAGGTLNVCLGQTVLFTSQSFTGLNQTGYLLYSWNFDDFDPAAPQNNTSSLSNPTHTFITAGGHNVTLTVTNQCGCSETVNMRVNVALEAAAEISCPTPICAGSVANYSVNVNCKPPLGQFLWSIDPPSAGQILPPQSSQSITVQWSQTATPPVRLNFAGINCDNRCPSVASVEIPIIGGALPIFGDNLVCQNPLYWTYSAPVIPGTTYNWTVTNGTIRSGGTTNSIDVEWNVCSTGTCVGTVELSYTNSVIECNPIESSSLTVRIVKELEINGDQTLCYGQSATYTSNAGYDIDWILVDENDNVVFTQYSEDFDLTTTTISSLPAGEYYVSTSLSGVFCNDPRYYVTILNPLPPVAQIVGDDRVCPGGVGTYSATATNADNDLVWTITGGTPTTATGPSVGIAWNTTGPFSVSVHQVNSRTGCISTSVTKSVGVKIFTPPANVPTITGCINGRQTYPLPASLGFANLDARIWTFSNNLLGSIISSSVDAQGNLSLIIQWNNLISSGQLTLSGTICGQPVSVSLPVNLTGNTAVNVVGPNQACAGAPMAFTLSPVTPFSTISYNVGNGESGGPITSNGNLNVTVNGVSPAQGFNIEFDIVSPTGCKSSATQNVVINPKPEVNLNYSGSICSNTPPVMVYTISDPSYSYQWSNGAGNFSTIPGIPGYFYSVTVTNSFGCVNSDNITLPECNACTLLPNITVTPTISIPNNAPCGRMQIDIAIGGTGVWTNWDIVASGSDLQSLQNTASSMTFFPNYGAAGVFKSQVKVYNSNTNQCYYFEFDVDVPVTGRMDYTTACPNGSNNYEFTLVNTISSNNTTINAYNWSITNSLTNVNFLTTSTTDPQLGPIGIPGASYNVTNLLNFNSLTYGNGQCFVGMTDNLPTPPIPDFVASSGPYCEGQTVINFTSPSNVTYWDANWNFGDGSSYVPPYPSTNCNASRVFKYQPSGPYNIQFNGTDNLGCTYNLPTPIQVSINPNTLAGEINPPSATGCPNPGPILAFSNLGTTMPTDYLWSNGAAGLPINATTTGLYYLTISNATTGCRKELGLFSPVTIYNVPQPIIEGRVNGCTGVPIQLRVRPDDPSFTYNWTSTILNSSPGLASAEFLSSQAGTYPVSVTISIGLCSLTSTVNVVIANNPPIPVLTIQPNPACELNQNLVEATNTVSNLNLNWSNGMIGIRLQ